MAAKAARKKPVRTAPARKDYDTEIQWLQAKLEHAQRQEITTASVKVERISKRIASVQKQRADLDAKLRVLMDKRDALTSAMPVDEYLMSVEEDLAPEKDLVPAGDTGETP